ncbi:GntR family transcriptional regulator [Streptomyces sp. NBC_00124]|uniref:GntR family transcriptional regulator n=1 Tax=Streptomyces sp. NBC_00124 TaxID=2975662 RepID=UPI00224EC4FD|nr:GntR family transcriptional regulator [Streptomyces sp. NBC_00124]MCX5363201.1 GntR family transcriptional regulator [Streptomyces sp. NBC_00124]
MSQQASPRGTFQKIADVLKAEIDADPEMAQLPPVAKVMHDHGVSRGVVLRAFAVLQKEGAAEPTPGGRWRVVREGQQTDRRPLAERLTDVFADDGLEVGAAFPSASALCERFDVSRPTVTKALERLEAAGWLSGGGQGKVRTVRALPNREESSSL